MITNITNETYIYPVNNYYIFTADSLSDVPGVKNVIWKITTNSNPNYGVIKTETKSVYSNPTTFSLPMSTLTPSVSVGSDPYYVHLYYEYNVYANDVNPTVLIDTKSFFAGRNLPETPTITYPENSASTGKNPTFNSSAYVGYGTIQSAEQWKFESENGSWLGFTTPEITSGFNTYTVTSEIPVNTYLYAKVRYKSNKGEWSEWSVGKRFITISLQPNRPTIVYPTYGYQFPLLSNIILQASDYYASDSIESSEWMISETADPINDANAKTITSSIYGTNYSVSGYNHTRILIPTSLGLTYNKTYYFIVRYKDISNKTSEWSEIGQFKTYVATPIAPTFASVVEDSLHRLEITLNPFITSSTYGTHLKTEFIVSRSNNINDSVFGPVITDTPVLYMKTSSLSANTTYYVFAAFINGQIGTTYSKSSYATTTITTSSDKPSKPYLVYPTNNSAFIPLSIRLIGSPYSGGYPLSGNTEWQISTNNYDFNTPVWKEVSTLNNYEILSDNTIRCRYYTTGLSLNTYYYVRIRYKDTNNVWSDWSDPVRYKTIGHDYPDVPTIETIDGQTPPGNNVSITPTIVSSAYGPINPIDSHISSDWQISYGTTGETVVAYSYRDTTNKTSWTPTLPSNSTLYVRVRYRNEENTGEWSSFYQFTTEAVKPETPSILNPVHGSNQVSINPTLIGSIFSGDSNHESTHWLISPDSAFSGTSYALVSGTFLTSITLDIDLSKNTDYYVKLRYKDSNDLWSDWSSDVSSGTSKFTTLFNVPTTPTNTSPLNLATNISILPTLVANSYSGDTNSTHLYSEWQVSVDSNFDSIVWTQLSESDLTTITVGTNGTFSSILLESDSLNYYTDYYWRVRYRNESGYSDWSTGFKFTTILIEPEQPINTTPVNGKKQVATLAELISSDYNGYSPHLTSTWEIYRIGTSTGTGVLFWTSIDNGTNLTSITIGTSTGTFTGTDVELVKGSWYKWRVKYANLAGYSDYSEYTNFASIVETPLAPTITNTQTSNVGISGYTITLSDWLGGIYGDHLSTTWEIATGTSFTDSEVVYRENNSINSLTSWIVPNLSYYTDYYVRAKFRNETDFSDWSSLYSFKTIVDVPNTPTILYPISNSTGVDWIDVISLQSNAYSSKESPTYGTHLTSKWELSDKSDFSNIIWTKTLSGSGSLLTTIVPAYELEDYSFKWIYTRVAYSNINGYSNYSDTVTFKLLPGKPNKPTILIPTENSESFARENGAIISTSFVGQGTHTKSYWEICESGSGTNIVWSVKTANQDLYLSQILVNSITGNFSGNLSGKVKLDYSTPYKFRVRHQNENPNEEVISEWSDFVNAYTTLDLPNRPIGIDPSDKELNQFKNPMLIASDYSGQGTHLASQWHVATDENFNDIIWKGLSVNTSSGTSLTRIIINDVNGKFQGSLAGKTTLELNSTYYWKVSYKNEINFSNWSIPISFTVKEHEQDVITQPSIDKKLEYLIDRFVTPSIMREHPKFKEFIIHWLKFLDLKNNSLIFNLTDFNTIKEFYDIVEVFDFADEIKNARFKNFMSENSLEVLKNNVYADTEINPEILRFFRSLNAKKGAPISFQILMKALGYDITISTTGTFTYKITNIDGKVRTTEDVNNFIEVVKLFHPAGMDYEIGTELVFDLSSFSHRFRRDVYISNNEFLVAGILSTVWQSELAQSFRELLGIFTYEDFDTYKLDDIMGFLPYDFSTVPIINFSEGLGTGSLYPDKLRNSFQRSSYIENGTSYFLDTDGLVGRFPLMKTFDTFDDNIVLDGDFSRWYNYTNLKYWNELSLGTSIEITKSLDSNTGYYACNLIDKYTYITQEDLPLNVNSSYLFDLYSKSNGINAIYKLETDGLYFNDGSFGTTGFTETTFGTTYINTNIAFKNVTNGTSLTLSFYCGSSFINGTSSIFLDSLSVKKVEATDTIFENNGTYNGISYTSGPFGNTDAAIYFSGGTCESYIEIPNSDKYNIYDDEIFTLSFWIKCNNASLFTENSKILSFGTSSDIGYTIYISGSSASNIGKITFEINDGTSLISTSINSHYINNTWNNVIIEYISNGTTSIFINNNLSNDTLTNSINNIINYDKLIIGDYNNSFTGILSDLRLYKRKLTNEEKSLLQVYNSIEQ